ncbi:hypothetical protein BH24ACI5_BH24ACI5_28850 [soil metagenome]
MLRLHHTCLAALLYAAVTLILAWPLALNPRSSVMPGDPDTDLFMWTLAWNTHALTTDPLSVFDANIYYPHRTTLAFSENLLGSTIFAAPVLWATGDMLLSLNAVALLSIVLSGTGAFILGRALGLGVAGAIVCGLVFAFSPARFFRLGQIHLATMQWVPFCLAFVHLYLDRGRRRDLRLGVAFFTLQALTSGHGAVFLMVALFCLLGYRFALGERIDLVGRIRDLGVSGVLLAAPVLALLIPYRFVQNEFGLKRALGDWETPVSSFFASQGPVHRILFDWLGMSFAEEPSAYLFPGFIVLILAAVSLLPRRVPFRRRVPVTPPASPQAGAGWRGFAAAHRGNFVALYGLLTLVSLMLAAGPPIGLWPLVYDLPGFSFLRVPSRFVLLGVLGLAVLAGVGFERLTGRLHARGRAIAAAVAGLVLIAECMTIPLPGYRKYGVVIPAADRWLATQPGPLVIAELPSDHHNERRQSTFMLHSTAHWQKTVHGHSGIRTPFHQDLYEKLRGFPSTASMDALEAVGVTHIVLHPEMYEPQDWQRAEAGFPAVRDRLETVYDDGDSQVFRLRR